MSAHSNTDPPIYKLHRDLLWEIFSLNGADPSAYALNQPEYSALTTTRKCSQVCALWRQTILESPSIWGNCIDLSLLQQEDSQWREEVLRRTEHAPLSVHTRYDTPIAPNTGVHSFLVDLVDTHWDRIQTFTIVARSHQTFNEEKILKAFGRPALSLTEFSLSVADHRLSDVPEVFTFPGDFRLFSDIAPSLAYLSIRVPFNIPLFPSTLLQTRLRHLSLDQPLISSTADLLIACKQMPSIKVLNVAFPRHAAENTRNVFSSSTQKILLPNLQSISIKSQDLDVYPRFLGQIVAHPGCALSIETKLGQTEGSAKEKVQKMMQIFSQYSNEFFDRYRDGMHSAKELNFMVSCNSVHHYPCDLRISSIGEEDIPEHLIDIVINALAALKYPSSILSLVVVVVRGIPPRMYSALPKIFQALSSVTTLITTPSTLSLIHYLSASDDSPLFPSLRIIFLRSLDGFLEKEHHIKPFLASRQSTIPIQVINLTRSHWPLGDLRFLDDLVGLKVVWKQDNVLTEYICGSGNPSVLSLGKDDIFDDENSSD